MVRGSNPGGHKRISSPKGADWLRNEPSVVFDSPSGYFLEVKRPGRKVVHSRPSSVEIKNEWSYTPTPLIRPDDADRDKNTLFLTLLY